MSERSDEIAAAARQLIIESGGSLPTVRQIAARSYLSPAAIYVHFPNFDAIVEHVRLTTAAELLAEVRLVNPSSLDDALGAVSSWVVANIELVQGCVSGSTVGTSRECIDFINTGLVECGERPASPIAIRVGLHLVASVPMLVRTLGFGPAEVEHYLRSLTAPLAAVNLQPPVESLHS